MLSSTEVILGCTLGLSHINILVLPQEGLTQFQPLCVYALILDTQPVLLPKVNGPNSSGQCWGSNALEKERQQLGFPLLVGISS